MPAGLFRRKIRSVWGRDGTFKEQSKLMRNSKSDPSGASASRRWNASFEIMTLERKRTVISDARECFIEILHHESDPGTWIVRRWKKFLWFKTHISSYGFTNGEQALAYASEMKHQYLHR